MNLFDSLWDQLLDIRLCEFNSQSDSTRATGWSGSGTGAVVVESPSPAVLIFRESGVWRTAAGRDLRFHNVYRWTRRDESVRLEHLRFGEDRPVYLFDLAPTANGAWLSLAPHLCRNDTYSAQLQPESHRLRLTWTVAGPEKQEKIEYLYSPSPRVDALD